MGTFITSPMFLGLIGWFISIVATTLLTMFWRRQVTAYWCQRALKAEQRLADLRQRHRPRKRQAPPAQPTQYIRLAEQQTFQFPAVPPTYSRRR